LGNLLGKCIEKFIGKMYWENVLRNLLGKCIEKFIGKFIGKMY